MGICRWLSQFAQRRTGNIQNKTPQEQQGISIFGKPAHPDSTVRCSYCGGAGTVWRGTLAESPLPSRTGHFGESLRSTPYQPCPVCRGAGIVSTDASR